jgi:hypothetical protein
MHKLCEDDLGTVFGAGLRDEMLDYEAALRNERIAEGIADNAHLVAKVGIALTPFAGLLGPEGPPAMLGATLATKGLGEAARDLADRGRDANETTGNESAFGATARYGD